ncbi:MAG: peptidase domain-containing ABC transporter [Candidatus Obscuribacterales bacterium]|nr:peptidase domain-containing ABC transporter [Candidatus Obscuribacterales bacterium]
MEVAIRQLLNFVGNHVQHSLSSISAGAKQKRKYPFIRQDSRMDCGPTCLAMLSLYYGKRININQIRQLCDVGQYGTSLLLLAETAEKIGMTARGLRVNYAGLMKLNIPAICHWGNNHFVVLYEISDTSAIIADPERGILTLSREDFVQGFSGFALELTVTPEHGKSFQAKSPFSILLPIIATHRKAVQDILIVTAVVQLLSLSLPMFTQVVLDKVVVHQSVSMLNMLLVGMLILSLFQSALSYLRSFVLAFVSLKIDQTLLTCFYRHLLSLPIRFFEDRTIGEVMTRFKENDKIRNLLCGPAITIVLDLLMAFVLVALIYSYNLLFGVYVCIYLLLLVGVVACYTPILKSLSRKVFDKQVATDSFVVESIRAIERVKSSGAEQPTRWKWEELFSENQNAKFKEITARNIAQSVSRLINMLGQTVLLWLGANCVINGQLSIGQFVALNMMVGMASQPILRIVDVWDQFQEVSIALERLGDVFETIVEEPDLDKKIAVRKLHGHIKFDSVSFKYASVLQNNAVSNVSFEASPGQLVAIVGESGCGKTTLLKLALGLHKPNSGNIQIDDHDLSVISLSSYRRKVGTVSQNEYLFKGTIRENLSLLSNDASPEVIVEAAKLAGIHDFVASLPYGYETKLSEGGLNLSGGQRQRLAIARSIANKPTIMLLDEATSALDSESEKVIQNSLERLRQGRTMLVIAHRLSTIRNADLILVMENGTIVERGTHDDLLQKRGVYYRLASQQRLA